jgi:hypothetical protein
MTEGATAGAEAVTAGVAVAIRRRASVDPSAPANRRRPSPSAVPRRLGKCQRIAPCHGGSNRSRTWAGLALLSIRGSSSWSSSLASSSPSRCSSRDDGPETATPTQAQGLGHSAVPMADRTAGVMAVEAAVTSRAHVVAAGVIECPPGAMFKLGHEGAVSRSAACSHGRDGCYLEKLDSRTAVGSRSCETAAGRMRRTHAWGDG